MALKTFSKFYYGHTITIDNQNIPFKEDGDIQNRVAELNVGGYSLDDFVIEVSRAMNATGSQQYDVILDRETRTITINASDKTFDLLVTDPNYVEISAFELMGYAVDKTGLQSYVGDEPSGDVFEPQFLLQKYIDFQDDQKSNQVSVNQSASGVVEVVKYGDINLMSCNITMQTNYRQPKDAPILDDAHGEDNLRKFMQYIVSKSPIEFMRDSSNASSYDKCFLESTSADKAGTGFILKEMYSKKLIGYWETGIIKFRKLD